MNSQDRSLTLTYIVTMSMLTNFTTYYYDNMVSTYIHAVDDITQAVCNLHQRVAMVTIS